MALRDRRNARNCTVSRAELREQCHYVPRAGSNRNAGARRSMHSLWGPTQTRVPRNARRARGIQQKRGCPTIHAEAVGSNKNAGTTKCAQSPRDPTETRVPHDPRRSRGVQQKRGYHKTRGASALCCDPQKPQVLYDPLLGRQTLQKRRCNIMQVD